MMTMPLKTDALYGKLTDTMIARRWEKAHRNRKKLQAVLTKRLQRTPDLPGAAKLKPPPPSVPEFSLDGDDDGGLVGGGGDASQGGLLQSVDEHRCLPVRQQPGGSKERGAVVGLNDRRAGERMAQRQMQELAGKRSQGGAEELLSEGVTAAGPGTPVGSVGHADVIRAPLVGKVGLVYDEAMMQHRDPDSSSGSPHPEDPLRIAGAFFFRLFFSVPKGVGGGGGWRDCCRNAASSCLVCAATRAVVVPRFPRRQLTPLLTDMARVCQPFTASCASEGWRRAACASRRGQRSGVRSSGATASDTSTPSSH
eukprot:COSAG01_NODE_4768_length_4754_cov_24.235661_3_plen_310_part_00